MSRQMPKHSAYSVPPPGYMHFGKLCSMSYIKYLHASYSMKIFIMKICTIFKTINNIYSLDSDSEPSGSNESFT